MFKKIFKHGSAYFFVSLLTKFTGFLILPVTTRYLSLDEFGLYSNIQITQQMLYLLATISLDTAYARFLYDYNSSRKRLRILTSTIVRFFILWNVIYLVASISIFYFLLDSWKVNDFLVVLLVPLITIFQQFSSLNIALMQSRHKSTKLLTISTSAYCVTQLLMLVMLIIYDMGINSIFISQFVVGIVVMTIHLKIMINEGLVSLFIFSPKTFKKNIVYAFGYIPASISGWVFSVSDRYVITYFLSLAEAGKYAFIVQMTLIVQVVMQSIQTAQSPIFMRQMKESSEASSNQIKNFITVMFYLLFLIYIVMVTLLPSIIEFVFPENYRGDYYLIPILALGSVFLALRKMFANFLVYYKKSVWISVSGYIPAIVNIILNVIFIPIYGIMAAALTTLFSMFLYAGIVYYMANSLCKIGYESGKLLLIGFLAITLTLLSYYLNNVYVNIFMVLMYIFSGKSFGIFSLLRDNYD